MAPLVLIRRTGWALLLAAPLAAWPGLGPDGAARLPAALGAALVLAAGTGARPGWPLAAADLALAAMAVTAFLARNRFEAALAVLPAALALVAFRASAGTVKPDPVPGRLVAVVALLFAACGIGQAALGGPAVSTLGNTNYSGQFAAALAAVCAAGALGRSDRILGAAAAAASGTMVGVSGSRGALLGLAAGATVLAAWLIRERRWKELAAVALLAALPLAASPRLVARAAPAAAASDRTAQIRLGLWRGSLAMAAAHPVAGVGAGNFRIGYPRHRDPEERRLSHEGVPAGAVVEAEDPHSTPLKLLVESGPAVPLAVLAALGGAAWIGWRSRRPEALAGVAGLAALAVGSCFNSLSDRVAFAVLAGFLAGRCLGGGAVAPVRARWIGTAAALGVALWCLILLRADLAFARGMATSKPEERTAAMEEALQAVPSHWRARIELAGAEFHAGRPRSAAAQARRVLEVHPDHVAALHLVSVASDDPAERDRAARRIAELTR